MPTNKVPIDINCTISEKDFDKFFLHYTKEEFADEIIYQIGLNADKVIKGETITIKWENRRKE